jgi:hypothetical protein
MLVLAFLKRLFDQLSLFESTISVSFKQSQKLIETGKPNLSFLGLAPGLHFANRAINFSTLP